MTIIIALNIDGGAKEAALQNYLGGRNADVFVLTEWRDNAHGQEIRKWAEGRGMHCQGLFDGGDPKSPKRNGVFIASKIPFSWRSVTPPPPFNNPTRTGVMMLAQAEPWTILACYFPQGKGDPTKGIKPPKPPFFATVAKVAADHADEPLLVIGDLNNGHSERDREGARFIGPEDFEALSGKGLTDLWRMNHGPRAREYSYISNTRGGGGNGFRIDHAFANETYLRRTRVACEYDHWTRTRDATGERLSNHSALIVHGTPSACAVTSR